jgi:tetratricopeptide (TPR) repeat protein
MLLEEIEQTERALGENDHQLACTRFNQYGPLIRLGRLDAAQQVVESCLAMFRNVNDLTRQARALSALANIWNERGDTAQAVALERQALAVRNRLPDPTDRSVSHHNLSNYLDKAGQAMEAARHLLAAIVYRVVTGHYELLASSLHNLAIHIHRAARAGQPAYELPRLVDLLARGEFAALAGFLTQHGVNLDELQATIDQLVAQTRQQALSPASLAQATATEAAEQLLQQLAQAAAAGQDVAPLLAELRQRLLQANPDTADQIDAKLAELRAQLTRPADASG